MLQVTARKVSEPGLRSSGADAQGYQLEQIKVNSAHVNLSCLCSKASEACVLMIADVWSTAGSAFLDLLKKRLQRIRLD